MHGPAGTCEQGLYGAPPAVPTLLVQGMNDQLFNANEALRVRDCLIHAGADVRMMTIQAGHQVPGLQPDRVGQTACGSWDAADAMVAWFDQHLRDGGESGLPELCWSLGEQTDVAPSASADRIAVPGALTRQQLKPGLLSAGEVNRIFLPVQRIEMPATLAGVPQARLWLKSLGPPPFAAPRLFVGTGVRRAGSRDIEIINGQMTPLRGRAVEEIELAGVGTQLQPGDVVGLVVSGANRFYAASNTRVVDYPILVGGDAWIPVLP